MQFSTACTKSDNPLRAFETVHSKISITHFFKNGTLILISSRQNFSLSLFLSIYSKNSLNRFLKLLLLLFLKIFDPFKIDSIFLVFKLLSLLSINLASKVL